jgi:hypothetical protein
MAFGGAHDATSSRVFLYSGKSLYYNAGFKDLWELDLDKMRWKKLWGSEVCKADKDSGEENQNDVPPAVNGHTLGYLEPNGLIAFGGMTLGDPVLPGGAWYFDLDNLKWSRLADLPGLQDATTTPVGRWLHTAVVLPVRKHLFTRLCKKTTPVYCIDIRISVWFES